MSYITRKDLYIIVVPMAGLLMTGVDIQIGYTQTNLQASQNQVAELEKKLADAKARQEKAQSVQMQLEEQEQKLAGLEKYLSDSDKYRVQVVEIRMNIRNIHAKIEAIIKEKDNLEQNLRLARNLQITMLREIQSTAKLEAKPLSSSVQTKTPCGRPTNNQSLIGTERISEKSTSCKINNLHIDDRLNYEDNNEITNTFVSDRYINQDEILNCAYQLYEKQGLVLHFILHSKSGDIVDLDILLDRREPRGSNYNYYTSVFNTYNRLQTLNDFKINDFHITLKND